MQINSNELGRIIYDTPFCIAPLSKNQSIHTEQKIKYHAPDSAQKDCVSITAPTQMAKHASHSAQEHIQCDVRRRLSAISHNISCNYAKPCADEKDN